MHDGGADLGDLPHRRQAVEPCHQRVLKRVRNGERRQRPVEPIALGIFDQDARFQHRLGEFLDEQWIPIGLVVDRFDNGSRDTQPANASGELAGLLHVESRQADSLGTAAPGQLAQRHE